MSERLDKVPEISQKRNRGELNEKALYFVSAERKIWDIVREVGPKHGIIIPDRIATTKALLPEDEDHEEEDEHPFETQARWLAFGIICAFALVAGAAAVGTLAAPVVAVETGRIAFGVLALAICAVILAWRNILK